jgi:hypothetical protein
MFAVCPGFKVIGVVSPIAPKREPATEIDEIVTGAVPEELMVIGDVALVPTEMLPNVTDGALKVSAGEAVAGESAMTNGVDISPACAVIVAV